MFICIEETEIRIEGVIKGSKIPEKPLSFNKMKDVKQSWESGQASKREERREERKQEIQSIRSRLFMVCTLFLNCLNRY